MIAGTNLQHMMSRMQKVINNLVDWGDSVGLTFNPSKTEVVIFTKSNIRESKMPNKLLINNSRVNFSTSAKYLGLTLDHKLLWNIQWQNVINRAKTYLFTIISQVTKRWGPQPIYVKWVYTAIIRPRILYAYLTWGHSHGVGKRMQDLHQINKLACKIIAPVRHTTPRKSLEIIYDLIPLDLQGEYEAITSIVRQDETLRQTWIGTNPKCPSYIGHRRHWYDLKNQLVGHHTLIDMKKDT